MISIWNSKQLNYIYNIICIISWSKLLHIYSIIMDLYNSLLNYIKDKSL